SRRLRERNFARGALGDVHVDRSYRPNLVRLRLGDPAPRDWIPVHLSLPAVGWSTVPQIPSAHSRHLALSLVGVSDHGWRRSDLVARRSMLARSHLSLLSRRDAANPEPNQSLSAFCAALVSQI